MREKTHQAADSARRVKQKVEKGKICIASEREQMNHCLVLLKGKQRKGAILGKKNKSW